VPLVLTTFHVPLVDWAMAKKLRLRNPAAIYHVMDLGDWRQSIFADDEDRERFLKPDEDEKQLENGKGR
jgi:hypothetical protein